MLKKIILQIALFSLAIFIVLVIFNKYFNDVETNLLTSTKNYSVDSKTNVNKENIIKEIYYTSKNSTDSIFEIKSKTAKVDPDNPSIIFMTDVVAKISFTDRAPVNITSKYAEYNNETRETNFFENIIIKYLDHNIKAEEMQLSTENNLATLSKNIIYKNPNINLKADKVEVDLFTKKSKIFMDDNYKKVQIIGNK